MLRTQPFLFDKRAARTLDGGWFELESDPFTHEESMDMPPTLRRGSRGDSVRDLQDRLRAAGFDPGVTDGIFGANTANAVRSYQAANNLDVDGIVGPQTWGSLLHGSTPSQPPVTPTKDWSRVSVDQRLGYVMKLLIERYGYAINAAAGIVGNLYAESGVLPDRIEGSSSLTPLSSLNFANVMTNFTPQQVMLRDYSRRVGPKLPGIGLAQWTSKNRRDGLFRHSFNGRAPGPQILFDMDAQVDYLVYELKNGYRSVDRALMQPGVTLEAASDQVVLNFERPGSVINRPISDPQVQQVLATRRGHAQRALRAYSAQP